MMAWLDVEGPLRDPPCSPIAITVELYSVALITYGAFYGRRHTGDDGARWRQSSEAETEPEIGRKTSKTGSKAGSTTPMNNHFHTRRSPQCSPNRATQYQLGEILIAPAAVSAGNRRRISLPMCLPSRQPDYVCPGVIADMLDDVRPGEQRRSQASLIHLGLIAIVIALPNH